MTIAPQPPAHGASLPAPGRHAEQPPADGPFPGDRPLAEHHVCWVYDDLQGFGAEAAGFLGRGLGRHDRVQLIGPWSHDAGLALLETLCGVHDAVASGALEIAGLPRPHDGDLLDHFRRETDRARADGHRGLTVAIDATHLAADADDRALAVAGEHALDRWMTEAPFAALCAYDVRSLGEGATLLASLHPDTNHVVDFQVFAARDGWLHVTGAVDALNVQLFEEVLAGAAPRRPSMLHVDARSLQYINQRGLHALDGLADRVRLVTDDAQIVRLARSLRTSNLEVISA